MLEQGVLISRNLPMMGKQQHQSLHQNRSLGLGLGIFIVVYFLATLCFILFV
jgi:hypothetical protein